MKKCSFYFFCCLSLVVCFLSCENRKDEKDKILVFRFSKENKFLVKTTYDSLGNLRIKQYFNIDTIPEGPLIKYNTDNIITAWIWFVRGQKNPKCGVFYNKDGYFDTLKGHTFFGVGRDDHQNPVIMAINPPQVKIMIAYKDFYKNKIFKEIYYTDPYRTDSMSLVSLNEYKYIKNHKYKIYFSIVDSIRRMELFTDSMELIPINH